MVASIYVYAKNAFAPLRPVPRAYSAPPDPLAGFNGATSKGRGRQERGRRGQGRGDDREGEREGKEGAGRRKGGEGKGHTGTSFSPLRLG